MRYAFAQCVFAIAAVSALLCGPAHAEEVYSRMVDQLKGGNTHIDYTQLRRAYVDSSSYDPDGKKISAMLRSMLRKPNCTDSLDKALDIQEVSYVNIDAHVMAAFCYGKMNQPLDAKFQQAIADGLIQSMLDSGDGTSVDTAFQVVSFTEEQSFMHGRGLKIIRKTPVTYDHHDYDRIEVVDNTDRSHVVFFNIDSIVAAKKRDLAKSDPNKTMRPQ